MDTFIDPKLATGAGTIVIEVKKGINVSWDSPPAAVNIIATNVTLNNTIVIGVQLNAFLTCKRVCRQETATDPMGKMHCLPIKIMQTKEENLTLQTIIFTQHNH